MKKLTNNNDNLTDEEKFVLSQGSIFDPIDIEKEDNFESIVIGNDTDDEVVLSDEDLKLFENNFIDNKIADNQLEKNIEVINENKKLQFFTDIFLPIGTYLAIMQLPILIFISRFFKEFITIVSKSELMQISFFLFALGVFGLIILKSEYENIKINFFTDLFSEKSQTIHFFSSLVIVAISTYEFTILLIIVALVIWLISNFNTVKNKLQDSYINKILNSIWKKIVNILGY
ncbi:hypothetical protein BWK58_05550 [Flavobacterium columnare]|nr:hypothetical protein BWK58_05550 [Flavobacterium columnare]